ncbi:hypothetical protein AB9E28_35525, partial [Rhizobium leguminosarum]|uniref:hypothetical protein n=1 Tax=Rhizobium leguminosarum TaxID=384 RepID=UPI003F9DD84A
PELSGLFSSFQINVPQLYADLDRAKAEQLGVSVTDVFQTLQIYLTRCRPDLQLADIFRLGAEFRIGLHTDAVGAAEGVE